MKNPIEKIREEHGLNRSEFGVVLGVVPETVRQIETGTIKTLSPNVRKGLERLGHEPKEVAKELEAWREAYEKEILAKILA